jgi:hypothetical protein
MNSKPDWMFRRFDIWLGELPRRHKAVIPGNQDCVSEDPGERSAITNAVLPVDSDVVVDGIEIWGSPVTPLS